MDDAHREVLRDIGRSVARALDPLGYILLLVPGDRKVYYMSNAQRADAMTTLGEWMARTKTVPGVTGRDEGADLKPEAHAARVGIAIDMAAATIDVALVLFVFTFGEAGHLAWWTNTPDARALVHEVLRSHARGLS